MSFLLATSTRGYVQRGLVSVALFASAWAPSLGAQCSLQWQSPKVLEGADGRPAYVESPAAVPATKGILLLGSPAFLWAERNVFDPPPRTTINGVDTAGYIARLRANFGFIGFVLGPNGKVAPVKPPASGLIRRPVVVSGPDGTIHVAWFASVGGSTDPDAADGTVWYAERRKDQWTSPTMVFSADRLDWSGEKAALLVKHNSEVHLVVPFYRGKNAGIAYIRRRNGRWTTTETAVAGLPSQVTAQFIGEDSLAVAFAGIGAPGVQGRNGQHVFLIRAALSDSIWRLPTLVHFSGVDAVQWLRMYVVHTPSSAHALALVWNRVSGESGDSSGTIYAIVSEDAGVTWQTSVLLPIPVRAATFTQALDSNGNVHIVVTTSAHVGATGTQFYHATLEKGQWTDLESVITDSVASAPALSSIAPDTMLLVWGNERAAGGGLPGAVAPVTKYVTVVSACPGGVRP